MSFFDDIIANTTLVKIRASVEATVIASGLNVLDWIVGSLGDQTFEYVNSALFIYTSKAARLIRGFASLDTSTDPGDPDAFDPVNVTLPADSGLLSNLGKNFYGTEREGQSFGSATGTFINVGPNPRTLAPEQLTYTWTGGSPPTPAPTYRNAPSSSIYTNADGTVTVGVGQTLSLPLVAEQAGTASSAPPGVLSLTTVLAGCSGTNTTAIVAVDREDPDVYRTRCTQAMDRLSLAGPPGIYAYLAAKHLDGTVLFNASGNPTGITRVYVSEDSTTGEVDVYYASDSGAAISDDVDAANSNISIEAFAVPGAITFGPGMTGGVAATEVSIHVVGTAKIKASPGLDVAKVKQAMVNAEIAYFKKIPVGGLDQVAGAGVVYTDDLQSIAGGSYPGLYNVLVGTPSVPTTAIALGHVATLNCVVSDWTITVVP